MPKHAVVLRPAQIRHLLRVTEATSRHPERDALVLLLSITCGMRITDIARIEIADVLTSSGAIREEVSLRAVITKGCRQRCIYVTHEKTRGALERYLKARSRQIGNNEIAQAGVESVFTSCNCGHSWSARTGAGLVNVRGGVNIKCPECNASANISSRELEA